jgi:hypothetical protein
VKTIIKLIAMKTKITLTLLSIICCTAMYVSAFTVTLSGSQTGTICQYVSVDFSANIVDPNAYTKTAVWKVDGVPVATTGPNTANTYFDFPNPGAFNYVFVNAGTHTVTCEVSSPQFNSGNPVVSNTLTYLVTQNEAPQVAISDIASGNPICINTLDVFTAVPFDAGTPTYTWYVDGIPDLSSTTAIFNYIPLTIGVHVIYCIAHSNQACDAQPPISNPDGYSNTIIVNVDPCALYMPTTGTQNISACGGMFYDSGGANNNYGNNENGVVTICPAVVGQYLTVQLTSFNTQAGTDLFTVHDGNSLAFPILPPSPLSGTLTFLPSFTSTVAGGCLTFRFVSNGSTIDSGWAAGISCSPVSGISESQNEDVFTVTPNPATSEIKIENLNFRINFVEIYDAVGEKIYQSPITNNQSSININTLAKGIYFLKVKAGDTVAVKKVVKM